MAKSYENEIKGDEAIFPTPPFENNAQFLIGGNRLSGHNITAQSASLLQAPLTRIYTAGEVIDATESVYVEDSAATLFLVDASGATGMPQFFGNTSAGSNQKVAQSIQETRDTLVEELIMKIRKVSAPTDSAQLTIEGDSGGNPDGIAQFTVTKAAADLTTTLADYTFTPNFTFRANTKYWLVWYRTGAENNTDYYEVEGGGDAYANGRERVLSGDVWSNGPASDLYFKFQLTTVAGRIYRTSARNTGESNAFVGFVKFYTPFLKDVIVQLSGEATVFSSLTAGTQYYLSNTRGAIAIAAGTVTRKVGIATSSTALLITDIW